MQAEESKLGIAHLALLQVQFATSNLGLIDESVILLSQKRSTLEERAIAKYFHKLCCAYSCIIKSIHLHMSNEREFEEPSKPLIERLRTVNENVASCVNDLLKIQKYNANFLEQYFEYDYCSKLLDNQELLGDLEALDKEFQLCLAERK